jgi:aspartate aminotransferase
VLETDADYCDYLLNEALVALVPGRAFGLSGHFRLSYAYAEADLREGLRRITEATAALK